MRRSFASVLNVTVLFALALAISPAGVWAQVTKPGVKTTKVPPKTAPPKTGKTGKAPLAAPGYDTSFVAPEFIAALVIRPAEIRALPQLAKLPVDELLSKAKEQTGIDPAKVEEVTVLIGPPPAAGEQEDDQPIFGVVIRTQQPLSVKELAGGMFATAKEVTHAGKSYYAAERRSEPCLHMPDPRTLVFAQEPEMKKMLAVQKADSPLAASMRLGNRANLASAFTAIEPVRKLGRTALENNPLPPQFAFVGQLLEVLETAELSLGGDHALQLALRGKDPAAATKINGAVFQALGIANVAVAILLDQLKEAPAEKRALEGPPLQIASQLIQALKPTIDRDAVVLRLDGKLIDQQVALAMTAIVPAINAARGAAGRTQSANNLKQLALAMHNSHDVNGKLPAAFLADKDGKPLLSWRVHVLPFVDRQDLYKEFHLDEPWDSDHNKKLIAEMPAIYASPDNKVAGDGKTTYLTVRGKGTAFPGAKGLGFASIRDGTSNSIMILDVSDQKAVIWTKPDDFTYDPTNPLAGLLGHYPNGFLAAMCDGAVQFIPAKIDAKNLGRLFTIDDGETVELPQE